MARCIGGYAVVSTVGGYGLVCWRDPNGIRPLSYGRRKMDAGDGFEYMVRVRVRVRVRVSYP